MMFDINEIIREELDKAYENGKRDFAILIQSIISKRISVADPADLTEIITMIIEECFKVMLSQDY